MLTSATLLVPEEAILVTCLSLPTITQDYRISPNSATISHPPWTTTAAGTKTHPLLTSALSHAPEDSALVTCLHSFDSSRLQTGQLYFTRPPSLALPGHLPRLERRFTSLYDYLGHSTRSERRYTCSMPLSLPLHETTELYLTRPPSLARPGHLPLLE